MPVLKRRTGHVQQWDTLVWYGGSQTEIVRDGPRRGLRRREDRWDESDEEEAIQREAWTEYVRSWPEVLPSLSQTPSGLRLFPPVHEAYDPSMDDSVLPIAPDPIRPLRVSTRTGPVSLRPLPVSRPWSRGCKTNSIWCKQHS